MSMLFPPARKGRARKTGYTREQWKQVFASAARYCKVNKAPGERIQDCIRRVLAGARAGAPKVAPTLF